MVSKKYSILILVLSLFCLFAAIETVEGGSYIKMVYDLSVGFIVSAIFYWVVVYLPERRREEMVGWELQRQYDTFKRDCISIFLILSKSQSYPNKEALLDQEEFRRYFKNKNETGEARWDAIFNGLQENKFYLRGIVFRLRLLGDEIKFARSTLNVIDPGVYEFFGNLSREIDSMGLIGEDSEDLKALVRFLWQVFAGWDWDVGYRRSDFIREMLKKVG